MVLDSPRGDIIFKSFWDAFQVLNPSHDVCADIRAGRVNPATLVPINLHGDGGRAYRKNELLVFQMQPVCGSGTRICREKAQVETEQLQPQVNFLGHSLQTRFLYAVLHKKYYSKDPAPLHALLEAWSVQLGDLYHNGYEHEGRLFKFAPIGMKGDLPWLAKSASMTRCFSHIRKRPKTP